MTTDSVSVKRCAHWDRKASWTVFKIIFVKMAWSEHLSGSDCGDEYSLSTLQSQLFSLFPETCEKTKSIELSGESSLVPLISVCCDDDPQALDTCTTVI